MSNKVYWRGYEELTNDVEFVKNADKEFNLPAEYDSSNAGTSLENLSNNRRDFLKMLGFGAAAVSLAACEAPVRKAIPFLNKPEEYDPSIANYYASTYFNEGEYASVLVKTREGRPIKVEGNNLSSINNGATSAKVQASVLSLYDTQRYSGPQAAGKATTWAELDKAVSEGLAAAKSAGQKVYLVSETIASPTTQKAIAEFSAATGAMHVQYDPASVDGVLAANQESFGVRAIPAYDFSQVKVVVSFEADFLGTWISPTSFARQFAQTRKLINGKKEMSRLYAFESLMSLTGANADYRKAIRKSDEGLYVLALYNALNGSGAGNVKEAKLIEQAAKDLLAAKGRSIVVSGSNDKDIQVLVNAINNLLGNYGTTIDLSSPLMTKQGSEAQFVSFTNDLKSGSIGAVLFYGANPVYNHPEGEAIAKALKSVPLSVSFGDRPDETTVLAKYIAPDHHYLEAWGDAQPKKGIYSLIQPTISPIFSTRQAQESLLKWAGNETNYYDYLKANWKSTLYKEQNWYNNFQDFWNFSLHDGVFEPSGKNPRKPADESLVASAGAAIVDALASKTTFSFVGDVSAASAGISANYGKGGNDFDLVIYESVSMGTGSQANNPWLLEMPDPITRACWENYLTLPKALATQMGLKVKEGKTGMVTLSVGGKTMDIPALVQPGQHPQVVGLAMGWGRTVSGKAAQNIGKNAFALLGKIGNSLQYFRTGAKVSAKAESYDIAHVQTHHTVMGRPVIQEAKFDEYLKKPNAGRYYPTVETAEGPVPAASLSLWKAGSVNDRPNHSWGMVIDLNSCFGCGACVVACSAENNVPVVGKQEVLNRREMHWIRIDRYYSSDVKQGDYNAMEEPSDDPEVVFQPLMCQHCNNAPCETVCPVLATTHSSEGLNQMAYNRCIGTRYCANNCPYKVRRFNWFSYPKNDKFDYNVNNDLGRMVLNPDVTVRARGVIEKCSMCIQRIQEGKLYAKKEGRRPIDGEIKTACAQVCPTEAITFGDMGDADSAIAKLIAQQKQERLYYVLEEINTKPGVGYLTKIRNKA